MATWKHFMPHNPKILHCTKGQVHSLSKSDWIFGIDILTLQKKKKIVEGKQSTKCSHYILITVFGSHKSHSAMFFNYVTKDSKVIADNVG